MSAKPIWFAAPPTRLGTVKVPGLAAGGLVNSLGIELTESGDDWVEGRMPVDARTKQPFGLLHGGASVALAETLASIGSAAAIDLWAKAAVGLEINANHLRAASKGWVVGRASVLHLGRTVHVWDIRIADEAGRPVCVSRCTVAIIDRPADRPAR